MGTGLSSSGPGPGGCAPRGRWIYAHYVKAFGDVTSQKAHIYEVISTGSGLPYDPTDPEYLDTGDLIVVNYEHTVQVGDGYAYVWFDRGVYAKWNPAFDEPVNLYSSIYAEVIDYEPDKGVFWRGDAFKMQILDLDTTSITDLAVGDTIIVPRRYAYPVGKRANTRFLVRAEHVIAVC